MTTSKTAAVCKTCKGKKLIDCGGYDGHRFDHDWKPCPRCVPVPVTLGHQHVIEEKPGGKLHCTVCKKTWEVE